MDYGRWLYGLHIRVLQTVLCAAKVFGLPSLVFLIAIGKCLVELHVFESHQEETPVPGVLVGLKSHESYGSRNVSPTLVTYHNLLLIGR